MSEAVVRNVSPRRLFTILVFTGLGPAIGTLAVLGYFCVLMLGDATTASNALSLTAGAAPMFIIFGYFAGIVPALICGAAFAFSPRTIRRVIFAPLYGAVTVFSVWALAGAVGFSMGISGLLFMLAAGAVGAFLCAWVSERAGWLASA